MSSYPSSPRQKSSRRLRIDQHLAGLQLPRMADRSTTTTTTTTTDASPSIRILIVSDIGLESACRLAEEALPSSSSSSSSSAASSTSTSNPLHHVDLCIACGPFCHDEDLRPYLQGRQRRRHVSRCGSSTGSGIGSSSTSPLSTALAAAPYWNRRGGVLQPLASSPISQKQQQQQQYQQQPSGVRSREEIASMEGLMTAALSQLESIVCRVLYIPGPTDPITTFSTSPSDKPLDKSTTKLPFGLDYFLTNRTNTIPSPTRDWNHTIHHHHHRQDSNNDNNDNINDNRSQMMMGFPPPYMKERRLTPNSRNIHQHWIPLCHGLGCAGLLYVQGPSETPQMPPDQKQQQQPQQQQQSPALSDQLQVPDEYEDYTEDDDDHEDEDDEDDDDEEEDDVDLDAAIEALESSSLGEEDNNDDDGDTSITGRIMFTPLSPSAATTATTATGMPPLENHDSLLSVPSVTIDDEEDDGDEDDNDNEEGHSTEEGQEQHLPRMMYERHYREQLEGLVKLAPPLAVLPDMIQASRTHTDDHNDDDVYDDENDDGDDNDDYETSPNIILRDGKDSGGGVHEDDDPAGGAGSRTRCQTILVTHLGPSFILDGSKSNNHQNNNSNGRRIDSENDIHDDDEEDVRLLKFPSVHEEWLESTETQNHVLLEIAMLSSGSPTTTTTTTTTTSTTTSSIGDDDGDDDAIGSSWSGGEAERQGQGRRSRRHQRNGNVHVILPGSLRQNGSYCIIDVVYDNTKEDDDEDDHRRRNKNDDEDEDDINAYRWRVQKTAFYTLSDL